MSAVPPKGRALVTGCAGFLGSWLAERLRAEGREVVGVDCFTDYYAREIKERNLEQLRGDPGFALHELDLSRDPLDGLMDGVTTVFHLAAQAGVRGSFGDGFERYVNWNILGTQRLLEQAVGRPLDAFVYASSSSVYGDALSSPTTEETPRLPVSPYGMTKLATEEIAGVYQRDYEVPVVGLRYFTVYGPRQRPDMAFFRFLSRALNGEPLSIYGDGKQVRDFTFVHDVVAGTLAAAAAAGRPGAVYNIGGGEPLELNAVLGMLEELTGRTISIERHPATVGDARRTHADASLARSELGWSPQTRLREGLAAELEWLSGTRGTEAAPRPPGSILETRGASGSRSA